MKRAASLRPFIIARPNRLLEFELGEVLFDLPFDALQRVVDRFYVTPEVACHFLVALAFEVRFKYLRFEL